MLLRLAVCVCALLFVGSTAMGQVIYDHAPRPKRCNPYYRHLDDHKVAQLRALSEPRVQVIVVSPGVEGGTVVVQTITGGGCGPVYVAPGTVIADPNQLYFRKRDLAPVIPNPPAEATTQPDATPRGAILIIPKKKLEKKETPQKTVATAMQE
jgi:hypothetical protein